MQNVTSYLVGFAYTFKNLLQRNYPPLNRGEPQIYAKHLHYDKTIYLTNF
jgi:hypothetical protein